MLPIVHVGHSRDWQGVFRRLALCRPMPLVPSSLLRASVLVALALLTATHAAAHAGSVAFWRITMSGTTARSEVLLSPDDVHRMAPGAATLETTGPVDVSRLAGFDAALLAHFAIEQDVAAVTARIVAARVLPSGLLQVDMEHASIDPSRALALRATLHAVTDHTHRVIGRVDRRGVVTSLVFDATTPRHVVAALPRASWRDGRAPAGSTRSMVLLGIEHILRGYDHLVFLGCLLLAGGTWRSRLGIVSAFTVAHSVTLVLAAMRLVNPPAGFVEPAIAVTIAYVALENLLGDAGRSRWPTALGFGLIHGFGFAGMLDVLDLPSRQWFAAVIAFNAGVEIGQVAVVAIAMPIVISLARSSWHPRVVRYASSAVLGLSVLWFVERLP
jgi:HupE/UreJ protein